MKIISRLLILSCLSLSFLLVSCNKENDEELSVQPTANAVCGKALLYFESEEFDNLENDTTSIVDIDLQETCLIVDFAYSGCSIREIDAMAFIDFTSFIPILDIRIDNADPLEVCQAFFTHKDTFDISSSDLELYHGMSVVVKDWHESFILDLED